MSERIRIEIDATIINDTNLNDLRKRVQEQVLKLANPWREDEGIIGFDVITVYNVDVMNRARRKGQA